MKPLATQPEILEPLQRRGRRRRADFALPSRWPWLVRWFTRYGRRYVGRNFHAVRVLRGAEPERSDGRSVLVAMNHPSWWDPMIALVAATHFFPEREHYAAIDAAAVERYRFFTKLGFFGIERGTRRGAQTFLRHGLAVIARPSAALWVTAQGAFTDARDRPLAIERGVAHLAHRARGPTIIQPMALEYVFWRERYPEALLAFGEPLDPSGDAALDVDALNEAISRSLGAAMDALASASRAQDPAAFSTILGGNAGVGGVYDFGRRARSWMRRERFDPSHEGVAS